MDSIPPPSDTTQSVSDTTEILAETAEVISKNWEKVKKVSGELIVDYGPRIILAIVVLIVGLWLVKVFKRLLDRALSKRKLDVAAQKFIVDFTGVLLLVAVFISVLTLFGVPTTSFVAILGAGGLAIGLALQGALQNFAGGILILIFHPYRIGHLIETDGIVGYVKNIHVFNTIIVTLDNKRVIIPNGPLMNKNITNYTEEGSIRVDLKVGVEYTSDLNRCIEVINEAISKDPKVLESPEPMVGVADLSDSAIVFFVRPFCKPDDYWQTHMSVLKSVREALKEAGIGIPFPQREITIKKD